MNNCLGPPWGCCANRHWEVPLPPKLCFGICCSCWCCVIWNAVCCTMSVVAKGSAGQTDLSPTQQDGSPRCWDPGFRWGSSDSSTNEISSKCPLTKKQKFRYECPTKIPSVASLPTQKHGMVVTLQVTAQMCYTGIKTYVESHTPDVMSDPVLWMHSSEPFHVKFI